MTDQPDAPARSFRLRRSAAALTVSDHQLGWTPIIAALAIDLADFATAGPIGLVAGLAVGGLLTMIVASISGARPRRAFGLGLLGAIYCALPLTEPIPLATMLTALHVFLLRHKHAALTAEDAPASQPPEQAPEPNGGRVIQAGPGRRHATT